MRDMTTVDTIEVRVLVDKDDLWMNVTGAGAFTFSWWHEAKIIEGSWDKAGVIRVGIEDPDVQGHTITTTLDVENMAKALGEVIEQGFVDACTGKPIKISDMDSCVADVVLQQAVLGKVVYG